MGPIAAQNQDRVGRHRQSGIVNARRQIVQPLEDQRWALVLKQRPTCRGTLQHGAIRRE